MYPYPHVDNVIPLMAEGLVLPYLDIPFQHASPNVLRRMRRPANDAKVLERIRNWREQVPDLAIRSSFVVGFPARPTRTSLICWPGSRKRSSTASARSSSRPSKARRRRRWTTGARGAEAGALRSGDGAVRAHLSRKLAAKVGSTIDVLIDAVDAETGGATGRSKADAPEIDGEVHLRDAGGLQPGESPAPASRMPTNMTSSVCPPDRCANRDSTITNLF